MPYYAGVDLGATNVRAAVADEDGTLLARADRATPQGPTGIAVTEAVLDLLRSVCAAAGVSPEQVRAVGVGAIGPLDLAAGTVEDPANLPDAVGTVPLVGPIRELVGSERVYLHNDTAAGVVGERFFADRNPDDMVYLTISSGIGAGVTVDGHVIGGWDGNAGEVGHMVVDPAGRRTCGCGRDGHWEAYCSGDNVPAYARQLHEREGIPTDLPVGEDAGDGGTDVGGGADDGGGLTAADVYGAAGTDPLADALVERTTRWNAIGLTNVVHAYAPIVVYVGGAVAVNNESVVVDPLRERLDEMVFSNVPDLALTTLGDDVVLRGAVASALTGGTGDRTRVPTA
ncbi:MAG: ROK family protein [Halobacteriaceae archaeon]